MENTNEHCIKGFRINFKCNEPDIFEHLEHIEQYNIEMLEMLNKLVYECQIRDKSRFNDVKELIKRITCK